MSFEASPRPGDRWPAAPLLPTMAPRTAFTLIELLVVIGVIALLLALFVPALNKARHQARTSACQVNLRQWGTALATFAEDNEGRFLHNDSVLAEGWAPLWILTGRCIAERIDGRLQPPRQYHPISTKGMLCPEAARPVDAPMPGGHGGGWGIGGTTWKFDTTVGAADRAWSLTLSGGATDEVHVSCVSYGFNGWLFQPPGGPGNPIERHQAMRSPQEPSYTNIFSMRHTSRIPLLLDCAFYSSSPTDESRPPWTEDSPVQGPMELSCMNRHSEHINSLFLDWSVRKVGLKELWTLKWDESFNTAGPWTKAGGVSPNRWPEWMRRFRDY